MLFRSDGPDITRIAADETLDPGLHGRLGPEIPKASEPTREHIGTTDCNHLAIVAMRLRPGRAQMQRLTTKPPDPSNANWADPPKHLEATASAA